MRCERAWTGCLLNPAEDPLHRGECKVGSDDKLALLWRTVVHVKPYRDGRVRVAARPVPFVVRSILEGVYTPDKGGGRVCCAVAHHARHGARGRGGAHAARGTGLRRHDLKRLICFALRVCFRFVGVGTRRSIATRRTQNQCRDSQRAGVRNLLFTNYFSSAPSPARPGRRLSLLSLK